ncbi:MULTISPECIES: lysylphosphatidylglycerol synthase domain-containing protein [unclassified Caballeronia]|uniref:lysylphosphatidylglycerol synthase domain-containing protein n=1 Tax=unclassified Caballeronia TaxID=2646786 RepID=UPI002028BA2D|nr:MULTISPECIES: lysylphosphatidylglycerol synthase domain-containing protein [unclassified Caballeronia]
MNYLGSLAAMLGLMIAGWLIWRDDPVAILHLLESAGAGLVLAALVHVLPMVPNAWDWRLLIRDAERPSFATMLKLVWIRESINGLLPVARIGGEIVSFRLLRRGGVRPSTTVASLVVDMQLTLISQVVFALIALGYVLGQTSSDSARLAGRLAWGLAALMPVLLLFSLLQHARPFERAARTVNRITSGKVYSLVGKSAHIDQSIKLIWRQTGLVLRYLFIWQTLQCLGLALEIWVALRVLGTNASFLTAFVLEALIQLLSSVAFVIPGSIGVQEGGFVLIGGVLGIDASTCLALAGARRVRDLLFFVPGLIYWQAAERSFGLRRPTVATTARKAAVKAADADAK